MKEMDEPYNSKKLALEHKKIAQNYLENIKRCFIDKHFDDDFFIAVRMYENSMWQALELLCKAISKTNNENYIPRTHYDFNPIKNKDNKLGEKLVAMATAKMENGKGNKRIQDSKYFLNCPYKLSFEPVIFESAWNLIVNEKIKVASSLGMYLEITEEIADLFNIPTYRGYICCPVGGISISGSAQVTVSHLST